MDSKQWWEGETETKSESDFYKMKVGDNKVRILTSFERVDQLFDGVYPNSKYVGFVDETYKPKGNETVSTQGWAWGIDRETGNLKIMQFGRGILKLITQLRTNEEYAFDDFPMPYDITIHNTGEGPNRYSVTAARKNTEVKAEELAALESKTSVKDIIQKIKDKKEGTTFKTKVDYPESEGEIPF